MSNPSFPMGRMGSRNVAIVVADIHRIGVEQRPGRLRTRHCGM